MTSRTNARIAVKLTARELELLTTLASDQLFRREFIDPKIPGFKSNSAEVSLGKALVERLRLATKQRCAQKNSRPMTRSSPRSTRTRDAV
jgi:hypothetical protein